MVVVGDLGWICSGGCGGFQFGGGFVMDFWVLLLWVWLSFVADGGSSGF